MFTFNKYARKQMLQFPQGYQDFQKYFSSCRFFIYVIISFNELDNILSKLPSCYWLQSLPPFRRICKTAFMGNFRKLKRKHLGGSLVLRSLSSFGPLIGYWLQKKNVKKTGFWYSFKKIMTVLLIRTRRKISSVVLQKNSWW